MKCHSDNPEKYINGFWRLALTFDLIWKGIPVIIGQTLSKAEKMIMEATIHCVDGLYMTDSHYLIGAIAVPTPEPN